MKVLATILAMLLLSTSAAYARGHGGGHKSGSHHGVGSHYSHGYTTKKGTHVSGSFRHNPRKKKP